MGFFDDEVYENLDWLSQATTPLVFSGNKILNELPNHLSIDKQTVFKNVSRCNMQVDTFVTEMLGSSKSGMCHELFNLISNCYVFKAEGDVIVDPINDLCPIIYIEKIKQSFSEKEVMQYVQGRLYIMRDGKDIGRINEILDLIGYKPQPNEKNLRSSRSSRKKMMGVTRTLRDIIVSNKWEIRDADLIVSFINWVRQYIDDGNLAALTNITKLKIMTHKKQPIYSIKEAT